MIWSNVSAPTSKYLLTGFNQCWDRGKPPKQHHLHKIPVIYSSLILFPTIFQWASASWLVFPLQRKQASMNFHVQTIEARSGTCGTDVLSFPGLLLGCPEPQRVDAWRSGRFKFPSLCDTAEKAPQLLSPAKL